MVGFFYAYPTPGSFPRIPVPTPPALLPMVTPTIIPKIGVKLLSYLERIDDNLIASSEYPQNKKALLGTGLINRNKA